MVKIVHLINPVVVQPGHPSYLDVAQPITFKSMIAAKKKIVSTQHRIDLITTQYPEDRSIVPADDFVMTPDLDKSIHDYIDIENKTKKLPRIADILQRLYNYRSDADILIYTNVDIGVYPKFYSFVIKMFEAGLDGFTINRVSLPKKIKEIGILNENHLEQIYKLNGESHNGFDCFVFRPDIFPKLKLGNIFVGYPPIGSVLKNQIKLNCRKFKEFSSKEKLTFHLGVDRAWMNHNEYSLANANAAKKI